MAFVIIDRTKQCDLYKGEGAPNNAYFYKDDVDLLLNQTGAIGLQVIPAIINGKVCSALIASRGKDATGVTDPMDGDGELLAMSCPPYDYPPRGEVPLEDR